LIRVEKCVDRLLLQRVELPWCKRIMSTPLHSGGVTGSTRKQDFPTSAKIFKDLRKVGLNDLKGQERINFDKETRRVADFDARIV
jgi:hypothetical protein